MMTPESVRRAYRVILGRDVESDSQADFVSQHYNDEIDLILGLLRSEEFFAGRGQKLGTYSIPAAGEIAIFREFGRYSGPGLRPRGR